MVIIPRSFSSFARPRLPLLLLLLLLASTAVSIANGQQSTSSTILNGGAIGNIYVGKFEDVCAEPLTEYSDCLDSNAGSSSSGSRSCFQDNLDLLQCAGNCPSEFETSWWCLARLGSSCTTEIAAWVNCATDYCADVYLPDYAKCVQDQGSSCSTCPTIFLTSDGSVISKPVCSDLDETYCEWQSCCEPCQYLLNFYGRCMQVNFNMCNQQGVTSLPSCPFVVSNAATPPPPLGGGGVEDEEEENDVDSSSPPQQQPPTTVTIESSAPFFSLNIIIIIINLVGFLRFGMFWSPW